MSLWRTMLTGLAALGAAGASIPNAAAQSAAPEKLDLRILYVGHSGSAREKDFVRFLAGHFKQVTTGDLKRFDGTGTDKADVVILDYDGKGFKAPRPRLKADYARATVTVGVIGAFICRSHGLKSGYL